MLKIIKIILLQTKNKMLKYLLKTIQSNQNSFNENNYSDVVFPKTNKPFENTGGYPEYGSGMASLYSFCEIVAKLSKYISFVLDLIITRMVLKPII